MSDDKKGEGFMLGVLIGGLIGAAASLLLGIEEQEEIKRDLKKKSKILVEGAKDTIIEGEEFVEKNSDKFEEIIQERVQEVQDNVEKEIKRKAPSTLRHFFFKKGKKLSK